MPYEPLEAKRVYQRGESLAAGIWEVALGWDWFAKKTVGTQLARAADSVGANVAEAGGRFHPADVRNFLYIARGSLRETKYRLRRALQRELISSQTFARFDEELEQLAKEISECINFQKCRTTPRQPPNHLTT